MKGCTIMEKKQAKAHLNGLMGAAMKGNLKTIIFRGMEYINGLMEEFMKDVGLLIEEMEKALLFGLMEKNMKEISKTIIKKG